MYSYFTKKQANILYSAYKQGKVKLSKKFINDMYNLVSIPDANLSLNDKIFRNHCENAIDHILNGRLDLAQYEIDGFSVHKKYVVVDTIEREATEDDWFYDIGEIISEDVKEPRYVVLDSNKHVMKDEKGDLIFLENGERDFNH